MMRYIAGCVAVLILTIGCASLTAAPEGAPVRFSSDTAKQLFLHKADITDGYFFVNGGGDKSYSVLGDRDDCSIENRITWRERCEASLGEACYLYSAQKSDHWSLTDKTTFDSEGQHEEVTATCTHFVFFHIGG